MVILKGYPADNHSTADLSYLTYFSEYFKNAQRLSGNPGMHLGIFMSCDVFLCGHLSWSRQWAASHRPAHAGLRCPVKPLKWVREGCGELLILSPSIKWPFWMKKKMFILWFKTYNQVFNPLWVNFCGMRPWSSCILSHVAVQFSPHNSLKK